MPYISIDFEEQKAKTISQLWEELTPERIYSILREIRCAFLEVYPTFSTDLPDYLSETKRYIENLLPTSNEQKLAPLHLIQYWATMTNVSCHEILFNGAKHDVRLFGHAEFFTKKFPLLPTEKKKEILEGLGNEKETILNPIYIMYKRSDELGSLESLSAQLYWIGLTSQRSALRRARAYFPYDTIGPQDEIAHNLHYLVTHNSMWWLVLVMCPGLDICLDYLIMHDYSHLATLEGIPLSGEQRNALSAYLLANPAAQKKALGEVAAVLLS